MGETRTKIRIVNAADYSLSLSGQLDRSKLRQVVTTALVDTGCGPLVINEETRKTLGLDIVGPREVGQAGGSSITAQELSPAMVFWTPSEGEERHAAELPLLLPDEPEKALLGYLSLERMDLRVNPVSQTVEGAHGNIWVHTVK
jgi:predicted aspartyl protease